MDETPNEVKYANWPPPRRPAPTLARTFIPLAAKHGGVTIAHVMAAQSCTMREALRFLTALARDGKVIPFAATKAKPMVWCLPRSDP